jgi:hypothetical protein
MHNLALQAVTVTDINYISVMNMKTECIHLADNFFTLRKL